MTSLSHTQSKNKGQSLAGYESPNCHVVTKFTMQLGASIL